MYLIEQLPLPKDKMNLNEDLVQEHAYLVSRGVRHLAIIDSHENTCEDLPLLLCTKLETLSLYYPEVIPFVHKNLDGFVDYGFAREPWVLEIYKWICNSKVPKKYRNIIVGLLCGYSTEALRTHNDHESVIL